MCVLGYGCGSGQPKTQRVRRSCEQSFFPIPGLVKCVCVCVFFSVWHQAFRLGVLMPCTPRIRSGLLGRSPGQACLSFSLPRSEKEQKQAVEGTLESNERKES